MNLGPGHIYGQCVISDKYKICYILIPKNMSSTMRKYIKNKLTGYEFNYFNCTQEQKKYFTFAILRDVKSRFYSAIDTILCRKIIDISNLNNSNLKFYVNNMKDEHLVKQTEFIRNIKLDMLVNMNIICTYINEIINKSTNITHNININDDVIIDAYMDDIQLYEQSKNMDLDYFLKMLKLN
jgi:hypothetical protein